MSEVKLIVIAKQKQMWKQSSEELFLNIIIGRLVLDGLYVG